MNDRKSMRTTKTVGILLVLAVLTAAVVFVPQLISERREAKRIDRMIYRDYNASERAKFTGAEVARLYYTRQIDITGNLRMVDSNSDDAELIRKEVSEQLDRLFGKGTDLSDPFNTRIEESENALSCYRSSCLILVDNHPTALNFVNCCIKENDLVFEITYEEKTKTLIAFSVDASEVPFRSTTEAEGYSTRVVSQMQAFFEESLQLSQKEYYCTVDVSKVAEGSKTGCTANAAIRCRILQADEKGSEKN